MQVSFSTQGNDAQQTCETYGLVIVHFQWKGLVQAKLGFILQNSLFFLDAKRWSTIGCSSGFLQRMVVLYFNKEWTLHLKVLGQFNSHGCWKPSVFYISSSGTWCSVLMVGIFKPKVWSWVIQSYRSLSGCLKEWESNWETKQAAGKEKEAKRKSARSLRSLACLSLDLKVSLLVIPSLRSVIRGFLFLPSLSFSQSQVFIF